MNTNIYIRLCVILTMYLRYCKASSYAETDASTSSKPSPFMYNKINTSNIKKPSKPQQNFKQFKSIKEEREKLYEAYNLLHRLAQDFKKPFDSPAVIVIGHQTSGKSALIEALMGFQFNQVGGGTKTRRPVALRMQYNPSCTSPLCFLTLENGKEEQKSLADIQSYIESENKRLERDSTRCFDPREINIRMEYKYCPNMIVIDTPGMLHAPKGRQLTPQQRALAHAAREAQDLVLSKIRCQDYIILCVEDTTDWKHATTRNLVAEVDPELSRTVLVTTKLDTKLPQFSEAADLEDFLKAPLIQRLFPHILGGPFFTSVPAGRVGISKDFNSNEAFVHALRQVEADDKRRVVSTMGLIPARSAMAKVGVTKLRSFLETRVEDNYRRNIAKIVPLLQSELRNAENRLQATDKELSSLSLDRLKQRANVYRERFSKELAQLIQGSVKPSAEDWGETLEAEQLRGGSFLEQDQIQSDSWQSLLELEIGSSQYRLFGGAQYHRAMREFVVAVKHMKLPVITEDEIANAAGLGDTHDGVNFMRAAAVIAMQKAEQSFEPMLEALRHRSIHIMKRLFPIIEFVNRHGSSAMPVDEYSRPFQDMIHRIFDKFVEKQIDICLAKCRDDLHGMTRYVTWDADGEGGSSTLYKSLPTPKKVVEVYKVSIDRNKRAIGDSRTQKSIDNVMKKKDKSNPADKILDEWSEAGGSTSSNNDKELSSKRPVSNELAAVSSNNALQQTNWNEDAEVADYHNLLQLVEEITASSNSKRTSAVVIALIQHVIKSWREHFARTITMKFNCFFLIPFIDDFPSYLRNELDQVYETGMTEMFDIQEARLVLQARRSELLAECDANRKLQERFDEINDQIRRTNSVSTRSSNQVSDNVDNDDNEDLDYDLDNGIEYDTDNMKLDKNIDSFDDEISLSSSNSDGDVQYADRDKSFDDHDLDSSIDGVNKQKSSKRKKSKSKKDYSRPRDDLTGN